MPVATVEAIKGNLEVPLLRRSLGVALILSARTAQGDRLAVGGAVRTEANASRLLFN